jgi:DNA-binding transcriptional LysR family regulator
MKRPAPAPLLNKLNWDDLRVVLAVAGNGTLSGAARQLAVRHSTVLRRIDALEDALQVRLFERLRSGYLLTDAGETLRQAAEQCEPLIVEAERRITGGDTHLRGNLRVTTGPFVAQHLLAVPLAKFCTAHPDIEIEMRATLDHIDLSQREADVALRVASEVPDYLVGRKLGLLRFRVYGWQDAPFMAGRTRRSRMLPVKTLIQDYPWISLERDVMERPSNRWLNTHLPASSVAIRTDHFPGALALLKTGIGVALMPDFIAQDVPGLVALSATIDELTTPLWVLIHPDLRQNARVRAFMQMVGDALAEALRELGAQK